MLHRKHKTGNVNVKRRVGLAKPYMLEKRMFLKTPMGRMVGDVVHPLRAVKRYADLVTAAMIVLSTMYAAQAPSLAISICLSPVETTKIMSPS